MNPTSTARSVAFWVVLGLHHLRADRGRLRLGPLEARRGLRPREPDRARRRPGSTMKRILVCTGVLGGGTALVFALAALTAIAFPQGTRVAAGWNGANGGLGQGRLGRRGRRPGPGTRGRRRPRHRRRRDGVATGPDVGRPVRRGGALMRAGRRSSRASWASARALVFAAAALASPCSFPNGGTVVVAGWNGGADAKDGSGGADPGPAPRSTRAADAGGGLDVAAGRRPRRGSASPHRGLARSHPILSRPCASSPDSSTTTTAS